MISSNHRAPSRGRTVAAGGSWSRTRRRATGTCGSRSRCTAGRCAKAATEPWCGNVERTGGTAGMYLRIVLTLAIIGAVAMLFSLRRAQTATRAVSERRMPSEADARLDARIAHVKLDGRFEDAVATLAKAAGVNIVVRWPQFDQDAQ